MEIKTNKLNIKLNSKYKSFPQYFEYRFENQLNILSGINGSGKSQLLEIIRGYSDLQKQSSIDREISIEGEVHGVEDSFVVYKSFRDYINLGPITSANRNNLSSGLDTIFSYYQSYKLDYKNQPAIKNYSILCRETKDRILAKYSEDDFNNNRITRDNFRDLLGRDFVLKQDDIFTNNIGEIFYNYISKINDQRVADSKNKKITEEADLPEAPWKTLNQLFEKLKFDYRFKNEFTIISDEISEQPAIFQINESGNIDLSKKRELSELSDGEKAIISLTFAVLSNTQVKILLLDEYDATLNPSLTDAFFTVIKDYFIDRGTIVFITTHSPVTIYQSPSEIDTSFYEVFKPNVPGDRIVKVAREEYAEFSNGSFFYKRLENQNERKEYLINNIDTPKIKNTLVYVEGRTDRNILEHAYSVLYPDIDCPYYIQDRNGADQVRYALEHTNIHGSYKYIFGLFDFDEKGYNEWNGTKEYKIDSTNELIKSKVEINTTFYGLLLPIPRVSVIKFQFESSENIHYGNKTILAIEHLFYDKLTEDEKIRYFKLEKYPGDISVYFPIAKNEFQELVKTRIDQKFFENIKPIFEIINSKII